MICAPPYEENGLVQGGLRLARTGMVVGGGRAGRDHLDGLGNAPTIPALRYGTAEAEARRHDKASVGRHAEAKARRHDQLRL